MVNNREIQIINKQDTRFPQLLKEIHDCPERIFIRGALPPSDAYCLSVVGTRKITSYGKQVINAIIPPLVNAGVVIVSGLAFGVDAAAHRATLSSGGRTIAILPGGVDIESVAPKTHFELANEISKNGCLISEHPPGTPTHAGSFPVRNRLIAGMSHATLIIEGTCKSGTMVTASIAVRENRDVLCVPGSIYSPQSAGPLSLIKQGATLVRDAKDIIEALNIKIADKPISTQRTPLLNILNDGPLNIDEIATKLDLPAKTIMQQIGSLEIHGLVTSHDRYTYMKI